MHLQEMMADVQCHKGGGGLVVAVTWYPPNQSPASFLIPPFSPPSRLVWATRMQKGPKGEKFTAQKYPRWWVQSFLAGIPTVVLGCRDNEGMLVEVRR